jgi:hypothetical protein
MISFLFGCGGPFTQRQEFLEINSQPGLIRKNFGAIALKQQHYAV